MDKKGQSEVWNLKVIAEVIFTIIIIIFLLYSTFEYNRHSNFNKMHMKNDLKLLKNTLGASPGEIMKDYKVPQGYKINRDNNEIKIDFTSSLGNLLQTSNIILISKNNVDNVTIKEVQE